LDWKINNGKSKIKVQDLNSQLYNQRAGSLKLSLLFVFLLLFCSCGEKIKPTGQKVKAEQPSNIMKEAHIFRSSNAHVDIEIFAPIIYNFQAEESRMEFPKGAKALFFNEDMTTRSVLTCGYALSREDGNELLMSHNVKIVNHKQQDTIYCEDLIWQKDKKRIHTERPIKRVSPSGTDYGEGLDGTETLDSLIVRKPHGNQITDE
jgi:LPS export ABC transporter protein LptC